ncbi:hypothetical protein [Streptosporangium sandarakinum]|uniref:hypothetical protein n=1 Tax=Streptosporangium sandarakinum TaxID=1260955 RepID=UPI003686E0DA
MITRSRITALALTAACAAVPLTTFTASAAQASALATQSCNQLSNGTLCATTDPAGYDAAYHKYSGATVTVRFHLECKNGTRVADHGSFAIAAGQRRSFTFSVGRQGECRVRLQDLTNATNYYTGYVS